MSFKTVVKFQIGDQIPMGARFIAVNPICNDDEPVELLYEVETKEKSHRSESDMEKVEAVISYLNLIVGSKFTAKAAGSMTPIMARIKEGRTLEDFKTVIDKKYFEWGQDPKWSIYLRPKTLFGNNFEGYLNQKGISDMTEDAFNQLDVLMGQEK